MNITRSMMLMDVEKNSWPYIFHENVHLDDPAGNKPVSETTDMLLCDAMPKKDFTPHRCTPDDANSGERHDCMKTLCWQWVRSIEIGAEDKLPNLI